MGLSNIVITPQIIEKLISDGYLIADDSIVHAYREIPVDAEITKMQYDRDIFPHGVLVVTLRHKDLWKVLEGAEVPRIPVKVRE